MSDIIFLRAWIRVPVPRLHNPVISLLQPRGTNWQGMRTVGQLRRETATPIPVNKNSLYKVSRSFAALSVVVANVTMLH